MKTLKETYFYRSSKGDKTYQTLLYVDGTTSCDCPGWTRRVAPDGFRTCRHTRMVESGSSVAKLEAVGHVEHWIHSGGPAVEVGRTELDGDRAFDFSSEE